MFPKARYHSTTSDGLLFHNQISQDGTTGSDSQVVGYAVSRKTTTQSHIRLQSWIRKI
jgi:hypothetical protein